MAYLMAALLAPSIVMLMLLVAGMDRSILMAVSASTLLVQAMLLVPNIPHYRFYEVGSQAQPLRKLGIQPPEPISRRLPVGRRRFLASQGR